MRVIKYTRTEFHSPDEEVENDLLAFVYDVPYLPLVGILPHYHLLNHIFLDGGRDGGMGPGAIWEPFEITEAEFEELAIKVKETAPSELAARARYCAVQLEFDPQFDNLSDHEEWIYAVASKHRETFQLKLDREK